ncbi:MAG TPA: arginase family protein [Acidimicrobiales bacterium]|nr:arginase family protein [Acidimicrobiales bacterium]
MSTEWPTAAEWLAGDHEGGIVVAGMPITEHSVTPSAYDRAPGAIRARLARLSSFHGEREIDLRDVAVVDQGDSREPLALVPPLVIVMGGHNAVTFHALSAVDDPARWGLLTLDAHHDVRAYEPGAVGNGSPVRALIDSGLPGDHVVQVGIHGFSNAASDRRWCLEQGITLLGPDRVQEVGAQLDRLAEKCDRIYVDLDIDVLDRAFAPGCPGSRPGGIMPRDLFDAAFAAGAHPAVAAVDIVELDPTADLEHITTDAAALALLNTAAGFSTRQ